MERCPHHRSTGTRDQREETPQGFLAEINPIKIRSDFSMAGTMLTGGGGSAAPCRRQAEPRTSPGPPALSLLPQQPRDHQVSYFGVLASLQGAIWLCLMRVILQYIREDAGRIPCLRSLFFLERKSGCGGPWEPRDTPLEP